MAATSGSRLDEPSAYSVGDLLRNRMGDDRWHLALVQRDEVWDVERMKQLLDSLLAGYPVGALLLCRTDKESKVIVRGEDEGTVRVAREGEYQLLDGQQRLNALYTMLTGADEKRPKYGRFYLDLTAPRQDPTPAGAGRRRGPAMPYLVWREGPDGRLGQGEYDAFATRGRCLDLSRLYHWAEVNGGVARGQRLLQSGPEVLAKEIDPAFEHALSAQERKVAADWLVRILRMWRRRIVPVMRATVNAPEDLLELFARLNRSGIQYRDVDLYFAAVKTFWNDAEPRLNRVVDASTRRVAGGHGYAFLTPERALRLISRLAGRGLGGGDVLPPTVQGIAGNRREAMVAAMDVLTLKDSSPVLGSLERFFEEYPTASRLKYGLRFVSEQLWDEVLGWAVTRGRWDADDLHAIDAYLLGGTVFRYATIFGATFSRLAFLEALAAGAREDPFPLRPILFATQERWQDLRYGRGQVAALGGDTEAPQNDSEENIRWDPRRQLGDLNVSLLLSIAQGIEVDHVRPLDIDHIYASALAGRMHAVDSRWTHHPKRWWVNTIGNMWLLDAGTNRALQDEAPPRKFELLEGSLGETHRVWPMANWSITKSDIRAFNQVDAQIDVDVDGAMYRFAELVQARGYRLLHEPLELLPDAKLFARDAKPKPPNDWEPTVALAKELPQRLGLAEIVDRFRKMPPHPHGAGKPPEPGERRPILDVPERWGWPDGWRTEFAYVEVDSARWQVRDVRTLYNRIMKWLWASRREDLLRWNKLVEARDAHGVGVIAAPGHPGRWDRLDDQHYLQMGLFPRYLLSSVQEVLEELDLADRVYVVYGHPEE